MVCADTLLLGSNVFDPEMTSVRSSKILLRMRNCYNIVSVPLYGRACHECPRTHVEILECRQTLEEHRGHLVIKNKQGMLLVLGGEAHRILAEGDHPILRDCSRLPLFNEWNYDEETRMFVYSEIACRVAAFMSFVEFKKLLVEAVVSDSI
jgi:hypothetical protein